MSNVTLKSTNERIDELTTTIDELTTTIETLKKVIDHQDGIVEELTAQVDSLTHESQYHDLAIDVIIETANEQPAKQGRVKEIKSQRKMIKDDAYKILPGGSMADLSHIDAAKQLSLSYAQVYSCRKGHTFKDVHQILRKKAKKKAEEK